MRLVTDSNPKRQVAVRMEESLIKKIDEYAKSIDMPGKQITRTDAIRMLIYKGLSLSNYKTKNRSGL